MEPLSKLFGSGARLKILRLFVFNQSSAFSIEEASERANVSKDAARKEITDLANAGFLRKKRARARAEYQVNGKYEHLSALTQFIRETTNIRPNRIVAVCKKAGTLQLIVLSGFFTSAIESQIDLLVVGDNLNERVLAKAVRVLEAELGREIRYASFSTPDFRYRQGIYDRLMRDIFDYPHRLLVDKIGM